MRVLDKEKGYEMYLSKRERHRFNYEHYWTCNFYRGYKAASAKLFQLDPIELVKVSEVFAAKIKLEKDHWRDSDYESLIDAVEEVCDEHTFLEVLEAGQAALINESKPTSWTRPEPIDHEKKRRGRKPNAWQNRMDESYNYIHWGHRTSKCWKDQSKRKRQWR